MDEPRNIRLTKYNNSRKQNIIIQENTIIIEENTIFTKRTID